MDLSPRELDLLESCRAGDAGVKGWFNCFLVLGVGLPGVLQLAQVRGDAALAVMLVLYIAVLAVYGHDVGRGRALIRKLDGECHGADDSAS